MVKHATMSWSRMCGRSHRKRGVMVFFMVEAAEIMLLQIRSELTVSRITRWKNDQKKADGLLLDFWVCFGWLIKGTWILVTEEMGIRVVYISDPASYIVDMVIQPGSIPVSATTPVSARNTAVHRYHGPIQSGSMGTPMWYPKANKHVLWNTFFTVWDNDVLI